ncbi:MAG: outer membrane beta-barrel protein [Candidatus Eisenbacteria bacterium]|uniref:Outer membrane beta-barrel protein n=1 Tax=Eiseniibacteriota bacterium TaxID=2212470 RepID=A0A933W993_UNCEI|nr:outer membrane beta-barrel protein [Candidatus Eisenbacteria bacterium]
MRRLIALTLVALGLSAGVAHARGVGIGAFAGMSAPVLQEDVAKGNMFGIRVPVNLVPLFTVEPYYASAALGEATETVAGVDYTREGFDEKAYGVNALLTMGGPVQFYPFAGVGQTSLKRTGFDDSFTTFNFGLGLGISPAPKFTLHLRGELQTVVDGEASRKFGNVTVGASYALFSMP